MTPIRVAVANTLALVLVAGQAAAVAVQRELWPFSPYPMYSKQLRGEWRSAIRMYGVTAGSSGQHEVPLFRRRYFYPLRLLDVHSHVIPWVKEIERAPSSDPAMLHARLRALLDRYEALRQRGRHKGPPLEAIRLYRLHWKHDPWVRKTSPDRRDLLIEITTAELVGK